jgi:hypothetical protein
MRHRFSPPRLFAALVVVATGCSSAAPSGTPVKITTYDGDGLSCYTNAEPYLLIPNSEAGTAMIGTAEAGHIPGSPIPLAWPAGYVGRRVGSEVAVYSGSGQLVATTGKYWYIAGFPNADNNPFQRPFQVGCASRLDQWNPSATPPPT